MIIAVSAAVILILVVVLSLINGEAPVRILRYSGVIVLLAFFTMMYMHRGEFRKFEEKRNQEALALGDKVRKWRLILKWTIIKLLLVVYLLAAIEIVPFWFAIIFLIVGINFLVLQMILWPVAKLPKDHNDMF